MHENAVLEPNGELTAGFQMATWPCKGKETGDWIWNFDYDDDGDK